MENQLGENCKSRGTGWSPGRNLLGESIRSLHTVARKQLGRTKATGDWGGEGLGWGWRRAPHSTRAALLLTSAVFSPESSARSPF